jgi:hypothetical protein
VLAYERRNLLASRPAQAMITFDGPADRVKPKLHILAIGINSYVDEGWTPPGSSQKVAFPPLDLAVPDAKTFGTAMQQAGDGLYGEVRVAAALNADARADNLEPRLLAEPVLDSLPHDAAPGIVAVVSETYSHI